VPEIVKQAMAGAALGELSAQVNAAAAEGGFSADDAHLSLTRLVLDEKGWRAIAAELARALERIDRIHAESLERVRKGNHQDEREAMVGMLLFESAKVPAPTSARDGARKRTRARARA
jgi:hypothetical protein